MKKQQLQSNNTDRIDELVKRYLSDDKIRKTLKNESLIIDQTRNCFCDHFDTPESLILTGTLMIFMGMDQWKQSNSPEEGSSRLSETLLKHGSSVLKKTNSTIGK
jgi:hypothetical protein